MEKDEYIEIKNARVNNLKNVSLKIPRGKLVVIAGVSGSGKSSLAFDTLYAEGQRRYVESLSAYARQFLGRMNKPECDYIRGIPPAIAIEQRVTTRNARSTVGTATEIYDYLRLLYARIGHTFSPVSGNEVRKQTPEDVVERVRQYAEGTKMVLLAPLRVSEGRDVKEQLRANTLEGYSRILVKGKFERISDFIDTDTVNEIKAEDIWIVVDRFAADLSKDGISRITDSAETAFYEGGGTCRLMVLPAMLNYDFSTRFEADGITFEEPTDNMFSFNSPIGACPECQGFGNIMGIDEHLVIPDTTLSVYDGCVVCWHGDKMKAWKEEFCRRASKDNFPIFTPYNELTRKQKDWLWHGLPSDRDRDKYERVSIDDFFRMVDENQYKIQYRVMKSRYRGKTACPSCHGTRLKKEAEYVKINGRSLPDLVQMPIDRLAEWMDSLQLSEQERNIAARLLTEITNRLQYLLDVGLGYLTLNRAANTLSGGENQRINLATSIGSSLVGSLYILDEPSIGLHSRDTFRLVGVLKKLRELGNTVIVVEHDEDIIRQADYLIDVGPDAGRLGGEIVWQGYTSQLPAQSVKNSHTIDFLNGTDTISLPTGRRKWNMAITVKGARMNNLKGIDALFPLNVMTAVTGVSGSGKSTLVKGILYPALKRRIGEICDTPGEYLSLEGDIDQIGHVEMVDQNPIGRSSRSNPATYVKAYDLIRDLYANLPASKRMGFSSQFFSFNAEGGRCEECKGAGVINVEMQFMADITLTCEACHGKRFKKDILDITYHGKNISDILDMTIAEAMAFFATHGNNNIVERLQPLLDVGLGYIKMGQTSSSLSGGENQRVKLSYFLAQEKQSPTMFIFDEPTTGLHFHDIKKLIKSLNALISRGHTVIIIEHNLEIIKSVDYVIDLGPEGGDKGGTIVATGTPEDICSCQKSITGEYLRKKLQG